ncbi:hypothetical protein FDZ71_04885 [bacterium]|nr:MAG: hypothetical protein FDZ71_04885 [bacterium]
MVLKAKVFFAALLLASAGLCATIAEGETRVVSGILSKVDAKTGTVVVECPTAKGYLTVGAVVPPGMKALCDGKAVELADLQKGSKAVIRYKRQEDRLIVLGLEVSPR